MRRTVLTLLVGVVLGIAIAQAGVAVTGGWYEYKYVDGTNASSVITRMQLTRFGNPMGWEPVPGSDAAGDAFWLRRPRIRLGW